MNIVISCDDKWVNQVSTMIHSLSKRCSGNHYYFLCWENEFFGEENYSTIRRYLGPGDAIHEIPIPRMESITNLVVGRWNDIIALRLFCPYYLPKDVDKFLYIDGDIVFRKDVRDFYEQTLDSHTAIVGIHERHEESKRITKAMSVINDGIYINSGFYLMNRTRFVELYPSVESLCASIKAITVPILYFDQDVLNILLDGHKKRFENDDYMHFPSEAWSSIRGSHCIHYTCSPKPWDGDYKNVSYARRYWRYGKKIWGFWYAFRFMNKVIGNRISYYWNRLFRGLKKSGD